MAVTLNDTGITFSDGSKQAVSVGRNKIINGAMNIAQRGTNFPNAANATYPADRFVMDQSSAAVVTASQVSDTPANNWFQYSARIAVTTADASLVAGDYFQLTHSIEGFNVRDLIGKTFTLSFWVRSSKTGTHCVAFVNSVPDRSYVAEYTISAANTWEFKTITVTGGLITAGTWDWSFGTGLRIRWPLASGSTYNTTAGAWQTGNFLATANQVNCLDTIGNIFAITGVQLEVGAVATPFDHRPVGAELALCQRYALAIEPGAFYGSGVVRTGGTAHYMMVQTPVTLRSAPSISGTSRLYAGDSNTTVSSYSIGGTGRNAFWMNLTTAVALGGNADPILIYNSGTTPIIISAEL
jgi:hypothetical protein